MSQVPLASIMGILNITPNSFSDGSEDLDYNLDKLSCLFSEGADYVDIGAEATNPSATPIDFDTEWSRLEPFLSKIPSKYMDKISVDTRKEQIAIRCLDYGVRFINSQAGMFSSDFFRSIKDPGSFSYACMHSGQPKLGFKTELSDMYSFFKTSSEKLCDYGLSRSNIYMDPGIGFDKEDPINLLFLSYTDFFSKDFNLLIGMSRKSFIGRLIRISSPKDRDPFTKGIEFGLLRSSGIIRTHNVRDLYTLKYNLNKAIN